MNRLVICASTALITLIAANVTIAGTSVVVPLRLEDRSAFLTAKVDGIEVPLILDTGDSSNVVLAKSVLNQLKAIPISVSWAGKDSHGEVQSPEFRIARLQIGDALFTNVVARQEAHSPGNQPGDSIHRGYLGTGLMKAYQVVIDFARKRLTLVQPTRDRILTKQCRGTAVPFTLNRFPEEPVTEANTDLGKVILWWDSGAQMTGVARRVVEKAGMQASDGRVETKRLQLGGSNFGPWVFNSMNADLPPFFDGFIGYDFFLKHVVCMDFPGRRVLIQPSTPKTANHQ